MNLFDHALGALDTAWTGVVGLVTDPQTMPYAMAVAAVVVVVVVRIYKAPKLTARH